jgi:hypothetical protein
MMMFRLRQSLGPIETDRLVKAMSDPEILEIIRQYGDMDRPSKVMKELMKKPVLYRHSGILLRFGIKILTGL